MKQFILNYRKSVLMVLVAIVCLILNHAYVGANLATYLFSMLGISYWLNSSWFWAEKLNAYFKQARTLERR